MVGQSPNSARRTRQPRAELNGVNADGRADGQTVTAIERAADALLYLAHIDRADSGITEIAHDLRMPKGAVHRILASLRSRNLIALNEQTRRYSLGPMALTVGLSYLEHLDAHRLAVTQLPLLTAATSETSTLSVRTGNSRVYVEQATPDREVIMSVRIGVPYPLHAGSSSKALLAFLGKDEIEQYLKGPLDKLTPATIIDPKKLRQGLAEIRERGWAESTGERQLGAASVAAPVFNHQGHPQAVVSVCGPAERFLQHKANAVRHMLATTRQLSEQLSQLSSSGRLDTAAG